MHRLFRFCAAILAALSLTFAPAAAAKVTVSFHSFNGSVMFGRYPHTFIVLEGTEDATGKQVKENFGFTAKSVTPAILSGPVEHAVWTEENKWIAKTNRHFAITLTDAQYQKVQREVTQWRNAPGKYYDLDKRNCIHFVGAIAQIAGLKVDYPKDLLRKPRAWLNHVAKLNPQVSSKQF